MYLICQFTGDSLDIQTVLPTSINNNYDVNELNNILQETANVVVAQLSATISISEEKEWCTDNEIDNTISLGINPYSAGHCQFSWWYSGIVNIDYIQKIDLYTGDYGLGSHN